MNNLVAQQVNPLAVVLSDPARLTELDTDKLKMLLDMHRQLEADDAKRAYFQAFTDFKDAAPRIVKNKHVTFNDYWHVTLDRAVDVLTPALAAHGLSHSWSVEQSAGEIAVTTTLRHVRGHVESFTVSGPPDTSGKKNPTQAIKSGITYLQRTGLFGILGLAESNGDDDGRGTEAEPVETITEAQAADINTILNDLPEDTKRRQKHYIRERYGGLGNIPVKDFAELVRKAQRNAT